MYATLHQVAQDGPVPAPATVDGPALVTMFRLLLNVPDEVRDRAIAFAAAALPTRGRRPARRGEPRQPRRRCGTWRPGGTPNDPWFSELSHEQVLDLFARHGFTLVTARAFAVCPSGAYRRAWPRPVARLIDDLAARVPALWRWGTDVRVRRPAGAAGETCEVRAGPGDGRAPRARRRVHRRPDRKPAPRPVAPTCRRRRRRVATSRGPFAAGPVAAPATGALLGSWVRPGALTQPGRIEAIRTWEATLGRPLDITHTYKRLDEPFFTDSDTTFGAKSTLMLSWAGGDSRSVVAGRHDALIRERARQIREFGKPLLLRYRWEMDRPNLQATMWSPADYIAMWKHVRSHLRRGGRAQRVLGVVPDDRGLRARRRAVVLPRRRHGRLAVRRRVLRRRASCRSASTCGRSLAWTATHPTKPVMIGEFGVARAWKSEQRAGWIRNGGGRLQGQPAGQGGALLRVRPRRPQARRHVQHRRRPGGAGRVHRTGERPVLQPETPLSAARTVATTRARIAVDVRARRTGAPSSRSPQLVDAPQIVLEGAAAAVVVALVLDAEPCSG